MKRTSLWLSLLSAAAFSLPASADLIINEVDSDNTGTDNAEFIELFDGGTGNTALDGYVLVFFNGSSDTSYKAFDLDGYSTGADGYFVVCGDAANVSNCDLDVSPDTDLIQNGQDAVALYQASDSDFASGTAVTTTNLVDALVYDTSDADDAGLLVLLNADQPQIDENGNGAKDTESMQRCSNGSGGARNTSTYTLATPTPGADNQCGGDTEPEPDLFGACGETTQDNFAPISSVQGSIADVTADASPLLGQTVIIEGIVTLDKQGGTLANGDSSYQYSGFWLQEEDSDADGDANTSEGVFVYDYSHAVSVGDKVRLQGTVAEYSQVTQVKTITDLTICSSDNNLPQAVVVTLPVASLTQLEALEGMRISNNQNLVVSDLYGTGYGLGNYGQFVVSSALHFQGTEIALPGSAEATGAEAARVLDTLLIDDGVSASYPAFIPFPDDTGFSADNPMRIGYTVPSVAGVMHAYKNNYTVIPDSLTIDPTHARTTAPVIAQDANLVIVGMNVLNYFNGDGLGEGFPTSRGAKTADAFSMQSAKIVAALAAMNADIIGLMEIENDGFGENSAIQTLVNELNATQTAGNEYTFVNPGIAAIGSDEITVGLLYRAGRLTPAGTTVILSSANSPLDDNNEALFIDTKNRPSLIQSFTFNEQTFTVSVNHLKSKGSACDETDEGADGQGNCNQTRTRAAQALVQFLATRPTGVTSGDVILLGDLNAYSQEDPMQVFYSNGFTNLKYTEQSTEEQPYSYSYSGMLGSLDHALATGTLTDWVVSVDAWHINSVEDSLMDYETEANGQDYKSVDNYASADPYRSSDHDPIVVALNVPKPDNGGPLSPVWLLMLATLGLVRRYQP
ncbi:ExeM/NucH family extracellular endonuclease [Thalassolituus sp. LLYu03]|uniref:ExeM/NucH family extracellular endonuclease n=1 Tax=Thalassolituus sp. LLYu03 TaxID=3421656 RepID=UPI003D27DCED